MEIKNNLLVGVPFKKSPNQYGLICIYKITSPTGKIYVGSTINFKRRMDFYKKLNCKRQPKLYASLFKYGFDCHVVEILEETSISDLLKREHYWGMLYDVLSRGNLNSALPKGDEDYPLVSDEVRWKIGLAGRKRTCPQEVRDKISKSLKGRKPSNNTVLRSIEKRKGKNLSELHKKKLSDAKKGKIYLNRRKVIMCVNSGVYYNGLVDASEITGISMRYLGMMLKGCRKNKTSLIYV